MRIGLLAASLSRQGGNVSAALSVLGRSLHRSPEVDVAAFGLRDEMTDADSGDWGTMKVIATAARGPRKFGFSRELDMALAEADLDLLHVHGLWTYTSVASRRWADATARPYIITPHGMLDPWALRRRWWKKMCAGLLFEIAHLRGAACLQARCEAEARAFRDLKLRNPICVVSNPLERMPGPPPGRARLTSVPGASGYLLVCLGPATLDSNGETLLKAWQRARKRSRKCESDWSLVLITPDENRGTLARECAALGVETAVHFASPSVSASRELWESASAVVLLPGASEQTTNAARAWSHRLPVLMCGARGTHADYRAAPVLVVQPTVECLAEGLLALGEMGAAERAAMATVARRLVETRVAPVVIAEDMTRVYRWALGRGPKPPCVIEH